VTLLPPPSLALVVAAAAAAKRPSARAPGTPPPQPPRHAAKTPQTPFFCKPTNSIIKVILQFCRENGLDDIAAALQRECAVSLNTLPGNAPPESHAADVRAGCWKAVLRAVGGNGSGGGGGGGGGSPSSFGLRLPRAKLAALYEQVLLEMVDLREHAAARALLDGTGALQRLRRDDPARHARLSALCGGGGGGGAAASAADADDLYGPGTAADPSAARDRRRAALTASLAAEVSAAPPGRLLALVGQALKWQRSQGLLPAAAAEGGGGGGAGASAAANAAPAAVGRFDLMLGNAAAPAPAEAADAADECAAVALLATLRMEGGAKAHAGCAAFGPALQAAAAAAAAAPSTTAAAAPNPSLSLSCSFATGSVDGFVELWDPSTGALCRDVPFQARDAFMMHDAAVLCLCYSGDGQLLVRGQSEFQWGHLQYLHATGGSRRLPSSRVAGGDGAGAIG